MPLNLSNIAETFYGAISVITYPHSIIKSHANSTESSVGASNNINNNSNPTKSLNTF